MLRRSIFLLGSLALAPLSALAHDGEMLEPPDGDQGILVGIGNNPPEATAWEAASNTFVAVEKLYEVFDGLSAHIMNVTNLVSKLNKMDAQGQIPQLSLYFAGFDPSFLPMDQAISMGLHDAFIDKLAQVAILYDKPLMIALGYEFNLDGYTEYVFPEAYRHIVDRMRDVHGVDNVAWVWNPFVGGSVNTFTDQDQQGNWKWWPGDRYVNWIGANGFNPTVWATKSPINSSSLAMIDLLDFADEMDKPVMILETSGRLLEDLLPTSDPGSLAQATDWMTNHFGPMFDMLKCEPQMKGFIYLSSDWTNTQWPTWGDHRMQVNMDLMAQYLAEIAKPEYQLASTYNFPRPWVPWQIQKPSIGGNMRFDVDNIAQGTPAALFWSPTLLQNPVPLWPYPGLFALGSPLIYVNTVLADANDEVRITIPIPNNPTYAGLAFESQFVTTAGLTRPMRVEIQ